MNSAGRILALDLGSKRIGLALSDNLRITAQPHSTLENGKPETVVEAIREIVEHENVTEIVIGNPKRLDGSSGEMANAAKNLAARLRESLSLPIRLWDERFSTHAAERALLEGNVRRAKRKKVVDQTAAAWILQGYLDSRKK
ncbi:MAG: Holliday junction resolvase RuvX [Candidatus Omnitrophota bacterium]|jgi:putative Holliday junction resolvase|nr:MAG: Holliday junction resolvase RuvX [Candidatus Omnitrophota bacterium]